MGSTSRSGDLDFLAQPRSRHPLARAMSAYGRYAEPQRRLSQVCRRPRS